MKVLTVGSYGRVSCRAGTFTRWGLKMYEATPRKNNEGFYFKLVTVLATITGNTPSKRFVAAAESKAKELGLRFLPGISQNTPVHLTPLELLAATAEGTG